MLPYGPGFMQLNDRGAGKGSALRGNQPLAPTTWGALVALCSDITLKHNGFESRSPHLALSPYGASTSEPE